MALKAPGILIFMLSIVEQKLCASVARLLVLWQSVVAALFIREWRAMIESRAHVARTVRYAGGRGKLRLPCC